MQFKLFALSAALSAVSRVQAILPAAEVVVNINTVTTVSADTNRIAQSISVVNFPINTPQLINNFRIIVTDVQQYIAVMGGGSGEAIPYAENDQLLICEAFTDFVRVHQVLLNTVIGKHGILARTPFTAPIAAVLRTVEAGVDELAFGLIDLIPTCAARATQDKQALDQSLELSIQVYSS